MVNQGLSSYTTLARGKTTLVRYFLRMPNCAPTGAAIQVVGGRLFVSSGHTAPLTGSLPLPPIGLAPTSPISAAGSDPLFVVEGTHVVPDAIGRITFVAELDYRAVVPGQDPVEHTVTVDKVPGTSTPTSSAVSADVQPLPILVVPMGNAGTKTRSSVYRDQFPQSAEDSVHRGLIAAARMLPVPDQQGEDLASGNPGLRYNINAGLLNLGLHYDEVLKQDVNYMPDGVYCGQASHMGYIGRQLQHFRTAWNSVNSGQAAFALGQISQHISHGKTTHPSSNCADGYAAVPGRGSWGRVVLPTSLRPDVTGTIAMMELTHNLGQLTSGPRHDGAFHSVNVEADGTAPDRAWNVPGRSWIAQDRSVMHYNPVTDPGKWHDAATLLEQPDWASVQCTLRGDELCKIAGGTGTSFAGASTDQGSFFLSGETDGTPAGTFAHTYYDDGLRYDEPVDASTYYFVQRGPTGILKSSGFRVSTDHDEHSGTTSSGGAGVFGTQFPADRRTNRIQIWKGNPQAGDPGAVLLFDRERNTAPQFISVSTAGTSVTASVRDEDPANLRLDLFLRCPGSTSPLSVAVRPENADLVSGVATFVVPYDTSLGCPQGSVVARVSDGFHAVEHNDPLRVLGPALGSAAIYSPTSGAITTAHETIALSGAGRDALDKPAETLEWSLEGPSYTPAQVVAHGPSAEIFKDGGLAAGTYTVRLRALGTNRVLLAEAASSLIVEPDADRDRIADVRDRYCEGGEPGRSAADDPKNATEDSDSDGLADVVDPRPCTSSSTVTVRFRPDSLRTSSNGVPVTVELTGSEVDLEHLQRTGTPLFLQVAGFPAALPALSFKAFDKQTGQAKFDRDRLNRLLVAQDLIGYVPMFVTTRDAALKGADPNYPIVFP